MNRTPRASVLMWRFFTGAHLDGRRRTNATWLKPGTAPRYLCNWWNRKPRLFRVFWRLGTIGTAALITAAYLISPPLFWLSMGAITPVTLALIGNARKLTKHTVKRVNTDLGPVRGKERAAIDDMASEIPEETTNVREIGKRRRK